MLRLAVHQQLGDVLPHAIVVLTLDKQQKCSQLHKSCNIRNMQWCLTCCCMMMPPLALAEMLG